MYSSFWISVVLILVYVLTFAFTLSPTAGPNKCGQQLYMCALVSPCRNSGECYVTDDVNCTIRCKCKQNYTGDYCDTTCSEAHRKCMENNLCGNNGICTTVFYDNECSEECLCHESYAGKFCDRKINECYSGRRCHYGRCVGNKTDEKCVCNDISNKDPFCRINETKTTAPPLPPPVTGDGCQLCASFGARIQCCHGQCITSSLMPCHCDAFWYGHQCDKSCANKCQNNGTCLTRGPNMPYCKCAQGFYGDENCNITERKLCHDGLECYEGDCEKIHRTDKAKCTCRNGWTGKHCNWTCSKVCQNGGICYFDSLTQRQECDCPRHCLADDCSECKTTVTGSVTTTVISALMSSTNLAIAISVPVVVVVLLLLMTAVLILCLHKDSFKRYNLPAVDYSVENPKTEHSNNGHI